MIVLAYLKRQLRMIALLPKQVLARVALIASIVLVGAGCSALRPDASRRPPETGIVSDLPTPWWCPHLPDGSYGSWEP
jgi:hypothetical protein